MRLIDADALKFDIMCVYGSNPKYLNWLNHAPTVDAVPVVRCKDCRFSDVANLKDRYGQPYPVPCCRRNGHIRLGITPDDYCSRAERKEE